MRVHHLLAAPLALLSLSWRGGVQVAEAAVTFVTPAAGSTIAGLTLNVQWADDGTAPLISDLTTYKMFLCAGGNDGSSYTVVQSLTTTGVHSSGMVLNAVIPASVGGTTKNAYFIQMISDATAGGTLTSFSTRFTLSDVTGTFTATQLAGITAVGSSTAGPQGINAVVGAQGGAAAQVAASLFNLAWADQTGPTKYAPMQAIPPSKITKKNATPLNPTSAFTIATTFMAPPPAGQTTIVQSQTASFQASENQVAAASVPAAMHKFLNRWRD